MLNSNGAACVSKDNRQIVRGSQKLEAITENNITAKSAADLVYEGTAGPVLWGVNGAPEMNPTGHPAHSESE